jgi:predicted nucleotidyltransferase
MVDGPGSEYNAFLGGRFLVPPILDDIRDRLLGACPSIRLLVLFGSHARGQATPESDYDLLVVAPEDESPLAKAARLRLALWEVPAAFDLVVLTPSDLEAARRMPSSVIHQALVEGVVLHEAA